MDADAEPVILALPVAMTLTNQTLDRVLEYSLAKEPSGLQIHGLLRTAWDQRHDG
jgi:hypothetical protein